MKFISVFVAAIAAVAIAIPTEGVVATDSVGDAAPKTTNRYCYWDGTAPFCEGHCPDDYYQDGNLSNCGDGKCCWMGVKVHCCKDL